MGSFMNIELIVCFVYLVIKIKVRGVKQYNGAIFNRTSLIIALVNGFAWCIYSVQLVDFFIILPTYIDTIINLGQLTLYQILPHPLLNKISQFKV